MNKSWKDAQDMRDKVLDYIRRWDARLRLPLAQVQRGLGLYRGGGEVERALQNLRRAGLIRHDTLWGWRAV